MLRLFYYNDNSTFKDFPDDVFQRPEIPIKLEHELDKATIEGQEYQLSTILHLSGSGLTHNSIGATRFSGFLSRVKQGLSTFLNGKEDV